jgi:hypothetical protein
MIGIYGLVEPKNSFSFLRGEAKEEEYWEIRASSSFKVSILITNAELRKAQK